MSFFLNKARPIMLTILGTAMAFSFVAFDINSNAKALVESDYPKLESGKIITKSLTNKAHANLSGAESNIFIQASPEKVWAMLEDQEKMPEIVPRIKKSEVFEKNDNAEKVRIAMKVSRFLPTFKYTVYMDKTEKYKRMKFNRIDGCFKELYGAFELKPYKDGTILTYRMFVDTGFPVPASVCTNGLNNDLPDVMSSLKRYAENLS